MRGSNAPATEDLLFNAEDLAKDYGDYAYFSKDPEWSYSSTNGDVTFLIDASKLGHRARIEPETEGGLVMIRGGVPKTAIKGAIVREAEALDEAVSFYGEDPNILQDIKDNAGKIRERLTKAGIPILSGSATVGALAAGQVEGQVEPGADAEKIANAIKEVESGGDYWAIAKDQGFGAYQFSPATWKAVSKAYDASQGGEGEVLKPTVENQDKVARFYIQSLLNKGHSAEEIASIWNSGQPDAKKIGSGTNKYGVKYDVPGYVAKVTAAMEDEPTDEERQGNTTIAPTVRPPKQEDLIPLARQYQQDLEAARRGGLVEDMYPETILPVSAEEINASAPLLDSEEDGIPTIASLKRNPNFQLLNENGQLAARQLLWKQYLMHRPEAQQLLVQDPHAYIRVRDQIVGRPPPGVVSRFGNAMVRGMMQSTATYPAEAAAQYQQEQAPYGGLASGVGQLSGMFAPALALPGASAIGRVGAFASSQLFFGAQEAAAAKEARKEVLQRLAEERRAELPISGEYAAELIERAKQTPTEAFGKGAVKGALYELGITAGFKVAKTLYRGGRGILGYLFKKHPSQAEQVIAGEIPNAVDIPSMEDAIAKSPDLLDDGTDIVQAELFGNGARYVVVDPHSRFAAPDLEIYLKDGWKISPDELVVGRYRSAKVRTPITEKSNLTGEAEAFLNDPSSKPTMFQLQKILDENDAGTMTLPVDLLAKRTGGRGRGVNFLDPRAQWEEFPIADEAYESVRQTLRALRKTTKVGGQFVKGSGGMKKVTWDMVGEVRGTQGDINALLKAVGLTVQFGDTRDVAIRVAGGEVRRVAGKWVVIHE
jgi:hypothetical protein